jgi:hypothetical protein
MKFLILASAMILSQLAYGLMNYKCMDNAGVGDGIEVIIQMLDMDHANLIMAPSLTRIRNPGRIKFLRQGLMQIINEEEAGPFPGSKEIKRGKIVLNLDIFNKRLDFLSESGTVASSLPCTSF